MKNTNINQNAIKQDVQIGLMTRMLKNQLEQEVEEYIRQEVMPSIEENIKKMAKEAVEKWSVRVQNQQELTAFGHLDKIMVTFVEHVINKVEPVKTKIEEK
jgi:phage baseplate assembly protein W